eukprot:INCI16440.3.p1 GENE.INCI16440.3~~INCI16440.3.p1  ORF type:complete len:575 (-),score=91.59 INCI16440.3:374-1930(-)
MSVEKKKKAVKRHLSSINEDGGVIMSGLLVKKGKRSYLSSARHCALTNDCFIYSSGEVRRIPVLNMQVSVARESFTLVDCSDESFTFRCLGKTKADREREVQQWTQSIAKARDGQKLVRKDVLKQGKTRDAVLVTTWLTERCLVTAEPFKTGATLILLQSVAEILPVPLEPALIMHTKAGKSLRLIMSTEKTQRVWLELIVENIRRAKLNASSSSAELFSDNNMPKDIEAEMRYDALVKSMRAAVQVFYDRFAPAKAEHVDEFLEQYNGREEQLFANLEKKYSSRPEFNLLTLEEARENMQRLQQQEDMAHRLSQQSTSTASSPSGGNEGGGASGRGSPPALPAVTSRISGSIEGDTVAQTSVRASVPRATPTAQALVASLSPKFKPPHETKCNCCFRNFTFTTRRHHCRCCNRAVCHSCSGMREATERMRALTSTPSGEVPDPQLLAKLVNVSLSELNPAVQSAQSSNPQQQQQQQRNRHTPGTSNWQEIRRSWAAAMNEGVKIRICDGFVRGIRLV